MITIDIPGFKILRISHLVLDYNGTIAIDGRLIDGVLESMDRLARHVKIHVLTADTFGKVRQELLDAPCEIFILPVDGREDEGKRDYIRRLGAESTLCIGNGRNDRFMLHEAALGIAVIQQEGAAAEVVASADLVTTDILHTLNLLTNPLRLIASLRS